MGSVTVRNIDDAIKESARLTAAKKGLSLEAELRALIERTYAPAKADRAARIRAMSDEDWVSELIAIANGADLQLPERSDPPEREREIFGAN